MPEQDNNERVLPGDTSVSHSSNEYISSVVDQIQGELDGVNNTVLDGNPLAPKLSGSATAVDNFDDREMPNFTETFSGYSVPEQPAPTDLGLHTLTKRKQIKEKKAA